MNTTAETEQAKLPADTAMTGNDNINRKEFYSAYFIKTSMAYKCK